MWRFQEVFYISCLVALVLIPILRLVAFQLGILDHPKEYGMHNRSVPRLGGLAICIAFVLGSLYRMDLSQQLKGVLVGSSLIFLTGLLDDLIYLRAGLKLVIQLVACGIMMFQYGVILDVFPNVILNGFFTALGIIGLTNAVNFLDNMDGLAAGLVMISSFAIFIVAYATRQFWLGYLSMALVGATAGFLVYNLRKAYVFMGDAGSTFLGFTLASLAVMCEWSYFLPVTLAVPVLILGVPILDMILITVLRVKENKVTNLKEWIDYTGKDHLSHRLMRLGLGERGAVFSLWALQGIFCMTALVLLQRKAFYGVLGFIFFVGITLGFTFFFRRKRSLVLRLSGRTPKMRQCTKSSFDALSN